MKDLFFSQYIKLQPVCTKTYGYKVNGGGQTAQEEDNKLKNGTINNLKKRTL